MSTSLNRIEGKHQQKIKPVSGSQLLNELILLEEHLDLELHRRSCEIGEMLKFSTGITTTLRICVYNIFENQSCNEQGGPYQLPGKDITGTDPPSWTLRIEGWVLNQVIFCGLCL
jgi:hypothetical protein